MLTPAPDSQLPLQVPGSYERLTMAIINNPFEDPFRHTLLRGIRDALHNGHTDFNVMLPQSKSTDMYYGVDFSHTEDISVSFATIHLKDLTYTTTPANVPTEEETKKALEAVLEYFKNQSEFYPPIFERGPAGEYYGYKVLVDRKKDWLWSPNYGSVFSIGLPCLPRMEWVDNKLTANDPPWEGMKHGIHGVKKLKDLEDWILNYKFNLRINAVFSQDDNYGSLVICKIALYGDSIIETELGFRAHKAKIIKKLKRIRI